MGEQIDDDDLRRMVRMADSSGNGRVNFDEFLNVMQTKVDKRFLKIMKENGMKIPKSYQK